VANLEDGRSVIPAAVTDATMRGLLTIYLDRPAEIDTPFSSATCDACGLERPVQKQPPWQTWKLLPGKTHDSPPPRYDLPEFYDRCPHCGERHWGGRWTWTHLRDRVPLHGEPDEADMAAADAELAAYRHDDEGDGDATHDGPDADDGTA
jgi:hypothetical protein